MVDGDLYARLGVSPDADQDEIQRAYRARAKELHPDRNKAPDAEKRFQEVGEAYQVLKDPQARARYDAMRSGAMFGGGGAWAPEGGATTVDLGDLFGGGEFDLRDLFGGGVGAGPRQARGRARRSRRGADARAETEVTLEEVLTGGQRTLQRPDGGTTQVRIPAGAADGDVLRVAGAGAPGVGGGPPGDLLIHVHLAPHPEFERDGRDLQAVVRLEPWEAVLGADKTVKTLDGTATLKVPAGVQGGQKLRLRGQGLPDRAGARGDLYCEARVAIPKAPSPRERELYEQLRSLARGGKPD